MKKLRLRIFHQKQSEYINLVTKQIKYEIIDKVRR